MLLASSADVTWTQRGFIIIIITITSTSAFIPFMVQWVSHNISKDIRWGEVRVVVSWWCNILRGIPSWRLHPYLIPSSRVQKVRMLGIYYVRRWFTSKYRLELIFFYNLTSWLYRSNAFYGCSVIFCDLFGYIVIWRVKIVSMVNIIHGSVLQWINVKSHTVS